MPLMICPECQGKVSDQAARCPHCGFSIKQSVSANQDTKPPKKKASQLPHIIGLIILSTIAGFVSYMYQGINQKEKDAIKAIVSRTSMGRTIVPWSNRAASVLRITIQKSLDNIGKTIVGLTHPTGAYIQVTSWNVRELGDVISLTVQVYWGGGFFNNQYYTNIEWKFDQKGHISFDIIQDTAIIGIASSNRKKLEQYFKNHVYGVVIGNIGGRN